MRGGPASHTDQGRHSRFTARVLQRPALWKQLPSHRIFTSLLPLGITVIFVNIYDFHSKFK